MKKAFAPLLVSLLAAPLLASQQAPPAAPAAPAAPPAQQQAAPPLHPTIQEAVNLAESGDAAGALKKLQAAPKEAITPPIQSLMGVLHLQLNQPREAYALLQPLADAEDAQPAVLYHAGRAALLVGETDAGREYLTRSVVLQPASPAARDLGMLTAREGRVVEAYSMLRPWALRNPKDTDARLMAANLALQIERPDDAVELLKGMPDTDPALRLLRAKALIQKKDGAGAVALVRPLLAGHPAGMETEVRRTLAEAELLAGNAAEAVKLLDGKTGGHPAVTLLLARAQHKAGDKAAALATLKPLADQLPEDAAGMGDPRPAAGIALEYAALLAESGRAAEALPFLEKSTRYYPRNPDAWKSLAKAYETAGRGDDAAKALTMAEEAARPPVRQAAAPAQPAAPAPAAPALPPPSEALQNAIRLMSQNQASQALVIARQEFGISKDPRALIVEVQALLSLKREEEALQAAEAALKTSPENPDFLYLRGVSQMGLRRWSAAEADLRKVIQLQPRHVAAMNDLAVLLINVDKKQEAQQLLEQVLQINPQDRMAAANLERLKSGG
ncbi:MAG TPA: tetratricopeptide repeat protein [Thermoanaerobaculia bacterium]